MPAISLCSYTYNDARLLHGLLASVTRWTVQPDEIVLVDDGSKVSFTVSGEESAQLPLRCTRLPKNKGFRTAKHIGISAATGDIIVSVDCDSRLHPNFLACAVERLRDPTIGLMGGCSGLSLNKDILSTYLNIFGDLVYSACSGDVAFICGTAFALRREVWEKTGGFSGFSGRVCEDHYLCQTIKANGYRLFLDNRTHVLHARRLTRHAFCRRIWQWCGAAWLRELRPDRSLPEHFQRYFLNPILARCATIIQRFPQEYLYLELLQIASLAFDFCNSLSASGRIPSSSGETLRKILWGALSPYPKLHRLLKTDLMRAGAFSSEGMFKVGNTKNGPVAHSEWMSAFAFLDTFADAGLLQWLEDTGVRRIVEDEAVLDADYSAYAEGVCGM